MFTHARLVGVCVLKAPDNKFREIDVQAQIFPHTLRQLIRVASSGRLGRLVLSYASHARVYNYLCRLAAAPNRCSEHHGSTTVIIVENRVV